MMMQKPPSAAEEEEDPFSVPSLTHSASISAPPLCAPPLCAPPLFVEESTEASLMQRLDALKTEAERNETETMDLISQMSQKQTRLDAPPPPPSAPMRSPSPIKQQQLQQHSAPPINLNTNLYPKLDLEPPPPSFEDVVSQPRPKPPQQQQQIHHQEMEMQPMRPQQITGESVSIQELHSDASVLQQQQEILSAIEKQKQPQQQPTVGGQQQTQQAVATGDVHLVQCTGCRGWMQVIKKATLVFCPTCQVVSPVSVSNTRAAQGATATATATNTIATATASASSDSTVNDQALAMALEAEWNEEEGEIDLTRQLPLSDIMQPNQPRPPMTSSQRALHQSVASIGGRRDDTPSSNPLTCLKTSVVSAGEGFRSFFAKRDLPDEVRTTRINRNSSSYPGESDSTYTPLIDHEDL